MNNANKTKKGRPVGGDASTAPTPKKNFGFDEDTPDDNGDAGRSMGFTNYKAKATMARYRDPLR